MRVAAGNLKHLSLHTLFELDSPQISQQLEAPEAVHLNRFVQTSVTILLTSSKIYTLLMLDTKEKRLSHTTASTTSMSEDFEAMDEMGSFIGGSDQSFDRKRLSALVEKTSLRSSKASLAFNSLAQLKLANMRLHGREEDLKYLKTKLRNLVKRDKANADKTNDCNVIAMPPELVLVSGVSGVGKSVLVVRGLRDPAESAGVAFAGGKFDLYNVWVPLQAFGDAMLALTSHVMKQSCVDKIKGDIEQAFGEDDTIVRAMPGRCALHFIFHSKRFI